MRLRALLVTLVALLPTGHSFGQIRVGRATLSPPLVTQPTTRPASQPTTQPTKKELIQKRIWREMEFNYARKNYQSYVKKIKLFNSYNPRDKKEILSYNQWIRWSVSFDGDLRDLKDRLEKLKVMQEYLAGKIKNPTRAQSSVIEEFRPNLKVKTSLEDQIFDLETRIEWLQMITKMPDDKKDTRQDKQPTSRPK